MIFLAKEDITGSGFKGAGFEMKGFQERNLDNLLKRLGSKPVQKAIEDLSNIEKDEWSAIATTATSLQEFVGLGGNTALFQNFGSSIKDTLKIELQYITAPLLNEINGVINSVLEPFLPMLETAINEVNSAIQIGMGAIEAIISGKLDQYLRNLKLEMQDEVSAWQKQSSETFWGSEIGKAAFFKMYGIDLDEMSAKGTAGGAYSGQFDIDPKALEDMLKDFELGGF